MGATCVVVVKEVSRCGGGTGSAGADGADGGRGGRGGGTGGGGTGDPLTASLAMARLDGLSRASPSSELCRRRVSRRSRKPRRPNMVMHPPSSSPAAKEATAECMAHTRKHEYRAIALSVLLATMSLIKGQVYGSLDFHSSKCKHIA